eukprot:TRINITY_DN552_c0_g1_i11.p1 TRINITY_DN552_c0_g1~~TRINITY_DN552_c0_g1_i11.p1  ORF type:complete len:434 (-),score=103.18 TRINITY_DN552_c0_g1_i11:66-1367(-)
MKLAIAALTRVPGTFPNGKPLSGVFVPHAHYDEDGGAAYLCESGTIPCYGSKLFNQYWDQYYAVFNSGIQQTNLGRITGRGLPFDSDWRLASINPTLATAKYFKINTPVEDNTTFTFDNVTIQLLLTPSETPEQMTVWLPDVEVIHVGDLVLFAQCNTFTWRGEGNRNVNDWIRSLQKVLPLPFKYLLGSALPDVDRTYEESHMRVQRAIEFLTDVHDYVVGAALAGVHPTVMENSYTLPSSLTTDDYEMPFFHPQYQQVRGVIETLVGTVTPRYADFARIPIEEEYALMVKGLGGVDHALIFVDGTLFNESAPARSNLLYAIKIAEAIKYLLRAENSSEPHVHACMVLYSACRQLGYRSYALSERNFYLTCAYENRPELFATAPPSGAPASARGTSAEYDVSHVENIVAGTEFYGEPRIEKNQHRWIDWEGI